MRYLVTGGAGFIGSHLVFRLVERGESVRVLDDLSTGRMENLTQVLKTVEWVKGDIRDPASVLDAAQGVDVILHHAALPSVQRSTERPQETNAVNVLGSLNVLEAARKCGVRRMVYAASSSVYGDSEALPKGEGLPSRPLSPYAASKAAGEMYCTAYYRTFGLETVSLRYFNVFGPRQAPLSPYAAVVPRFIQALLSGQSPTIFGDGEQTRDFTYVGNAVEACLKAVEAPNAAGEVFNVACGARSSVNQLLAHLNTIMGSTTPAAYVEARPGDVKHSQADITKAKRVLGYEPKVDLLSGLKQTVEWFCSKAAG